jgi:hypothetical protein
LKPHSKEISMSGKDRYLSPTLFSANLTSADCSDTTTLRLYNLTDKSLFKENWLQEAIARNPELVIAACREAGFTNEKWRFWKKEVTVPDCAGSIDILLVSESGRIGIVETKLAYNPGARREVVAQILEYAINLGSIHLPTPPKTVNGDDFIDRQSVQVRIEEEGDYLLIIAGDRLDPRAVKLSEALLGKHMLRAWELALVEIAVFEHEAEGAQKSHLLVPHVRGTIVPVRRQVVTIRREGDRTRVEVTQSTTAAAGWDEESFFAKVKGLSASLHQFAEGLRHLREEPNVSLAFGRGKTPSLTVQRDGQGIVTLYLDGAGFLDFNKPAFARALGKERGDHYQSRLQAMFPEEMKKDWVRVKLQPSTIGQVLDETLKLLLEVLALP